MPNWYSKNNVPNPYVNEILVEEARSFSNSGNNHKLYGIFAHYFGAADILEDIKIGKRGPDEGPYPIEKWQEMVERAEKELKDFISGEKIKRLQ